MYVRWFVSIARIEIEPIRPQPQDCWHAQCSLQQGWCRNLRLEEMGYTQLRVQFLLARLRRAFLPDSPTPGGSLRFVHRGLISRHAYGVQSKAARRAAWILARDGAERHRSSSRFEKRLWFLGNDFVVFPKLESELPYIRAVLLARWLGGHGSFDGFQRNACSQGKACFFYGPSSIFEDSPG